jgi:hypothetical protein
MTKKTTGATRPDPSGPLRVASPFRVTEGGGNTKYEVGDQVRLEDMPEQSVEWLVRDGFIVPEQDYRRIAQVADESGLSLPQVVAQAQSDRSHVARATGVGREGLPFAELVEGVAGRLEVPPLEDMPPLASTPGITAELEDEDDAPWLDDEIERSLWLEDDLEDDDDGA